MGSRMMKSLARGPSATTTAGTSPSGQRRVPCFVRMPASRMTSSGDHGMICSANSVFSSRGVSIDCRTMTRAACTGKATLISEQHDEDCKPRGECAQHRVAPEQAQASILHSAQGGTATAGGTSPRGLHVGRLGQRRRRPAMPAGACCGSSIHRAMRRAPCRRSARRQPSRSQHRNLADPRLPFRGPV